MDEDDLIRVPPVGLFILLLTASVVFAIAALV